MNHSSPTHHQNVDPSEEETVVQARKYWRRLESQVVGAMGEEEQAVSPESLDSEAAS